MASDKKASETGTLRCTWGIILLPVCLFLALSLFSYDWQDINLLAVPPQDPPRNLIGPVGAWLSFTLFSALGVGAYLVPLFCLLLGVLLIVNREERIWPRIVWCAILVLAIANLMELHGNKWISVCRTLNIEDAGGIFSHMLTGSLLVKWFSSVGAGIVLWGVLAVALVMFAGIHNIAQGFQYALVGGSFVADKVGGWISGRTEKQLEMERQEQEMEKRRKRLERVVARPERTAELIPEPTPSEAKPEPSPVEREVEQKTVEAPQKPAPKKQKPAEAPAPATPKPAVTEDYRLPPLDLLDPVPEVKDKAIKTDTSTAAKILIETLAEFAVEAQVVNIEEGPVVTRYELLPAPGVRVEKITGLSNNLAMALKANSVRVQAPIPGKGLVGIEVPNASAILVSLREILESDTWKAGKAKVPLVLGKDVGGNDMVGDLAAMPHLLIAGATGSGKTVCMNSILLGLLMSKSPAELRLLLVDPKIVEFTVYDKLPHLVVPVVTNPKKVAIALRWAINEMEKRYKLFAKVGVRNIESYNNREIAKQQDLFGELPGGAEKENEQPVKLPYVVIVVDELADLMLVDQSEIENCIARLAQLSRAVGIHMILSTQRPSVKVITGTIKANFPSRIAFQLPQQVDSRTILDSAGAEKLLGRGDMLFMPPGTSKMIRAQGAICRDEEIHRIVDFIKKQSEPSYEAEIHEKLEKTTSGSAADELDGDDEELVKQATNIIRETHRASTSSLQRRLRIGYTRAARIVDILEERGILGPPRGSDAREILIDLDGAMADNVAETGNEEQKREEA
jgi:DNA segregation ATPase FtsK/SpoIIIE, S-DNA-T family